MGLKSGILTMAAGMVADIIGDMITKEGVTEFRNMVIDLANKLADKTETQFDDKMVDFLMGEAFSVENYTEYGSSLIAAAISYVQNSETKYDDYLLPILQGLDESFEPEV